jgi:Ser/Thr protein kinase RdoA (MazF antagonist)
MQSNTNTEQHLAPKHCMPSYCYSYVQAALAELHRLRICHGDVYAHNVLVDDDGNAVLLDYGACCDRV